MVMKVRRSKQKAAAACSSFAEKPPAADDVAPLTPPGCPEAAEAFAFFFENEDDINTFSKWSREPMLM
jgi:hypothetical protein